MNMHMSYWFGTSVGDLLFKGFTITSSPGLVMTCIGLASLAILFEAIKVYQAHAKHNVILDDDHCHSEHCTNERTSLLNNQKRNLLPYSHKFLILLQETAWYVMQNVLSYMLMLCVMTYNGYFTIAVTVGAGLGYLVFGPVLLEIGLKNGGMRRPRRVCKICIEASKSEENKSREHTLPAIAEGIMHCANPPDQQEKSSEQDDRSPVEGNSDKVQCHESVAEVHRADPSAQLDSSVESDQRPAEEQCHDSVAIVHRSDD